jgi:predicted transcriptional regulator
MNKKEVSDWIKQPVINQVLLSFATPHTPRQVERKLDRIKKLKMKPYMERGLIKSLSDGLKKGRYYTLTSKAREMLKLSDYESKTEKDWELIGWVMASKLNRLVILKIMAIDSVKRASEDIRKRCVRLNPCLTRISTKTILLELIKKGLVETEMNGKYRNYWLNEKGLVLMNDINELQLSAEICIKGEN